MKNLLVLFALVGAAVSYEKPLQYYHENVGIPAAVRIKVQEEAIDFDGTRIVGGSLASLGQFPYVGGLIIRLAWGITSVCGSSLLTNRRSVSAAHCFWDGRHWADSMLVVHGSTLLFSGGNRVTTTFFDLHDDYNTATYNNNIAIISHAFVTYTATIRNIALPLDMLNDDFVGIWAEAVGFGINYAGGQITDAQALRRAWLIPITNAECRQTYGPINIQSTNICTATGGGICSGDSGGPLVAYNTLIGIASFFPARGCDFSVPSVFTRVTSYHIWIRSRL